MSEDNILFNDIFDIKEIDPDGKHFDRVSRLRARSENYEMALTLDYNNELYPLEVSDKFSLVLASSLSLDPVGTRSTEKKESWRERQPGERDLSDDYEYVMYGKIFKSDETGASGKLPAGRIATFISFGGLLMCLEGEFRHLQNLNVGENVYLLMRK